MELSKKSLRTIFFGAIGCVVLYWLLHETDRVSVFFKGLLNLLNPFLIGGCLAFILNVPMRAIEKRLRRIPWMRWHRPVAIMLTLLLLVMILVMVFYMLIPQLQETLMTLGKQLPGFFDRTQKMITKALEDNPEMLQWFLENTDFQSYNWPAIVKHAVDLLGQGLGKVLDGAVTAVGGVISGIWSIFLAGVFAMYCLSGKENLARQGRSVIYCLFPEKWADEVIRILRLANSTFSSFISGQCVEVVILGSLFVVGMSIFGMPYIPLVSVLVAITAFIPVVGAWLGCVLGAFFILVNDPVQAFWFVILFLVLQQIENNLIYPRVVGTSIGLPSMWVLVAVTVGGELMGVAGMLLMIPLTSVLYTLAKEYAQICLTRRKIPSEKLRPQPPELKSKLKEKHEVAKQKRQAKEHNEQDNG